jgi:hypothetical protein
MKATVYYDTDGVIQSVVYMQPRSRITPCSTEHTSLEINLKDVKPNALVHIHSKYRVDVANRKLIPSTARRVINPNT